MLKQVHSEQESTGATVAVSPAVTTSAVEHLTQEELREVVTLWKEQRGDEQRQSELPQLNDVATALDVSEAEARHLLTRVRQVRQKKARQRRVLTVVVLSATLAFVIVAMLRWNTQLAYLNQQEGPFSTLGRQIVPLKANMLSDTYGPGAKVTRVDVLLRYNPPSLWRAIVGPDWNPSKQMGYLTDQEGRKYENFSRGSEQGPKVSMTTGWLKPLGGQVYSLGYAYPAARLPVSATNLTLHGSVAADNQDPVPFFVDIPWRE